MSDQRYHGMTIEQYIAHLQGELQMVRQLLRYVETAGLSPAVKARIIQHLEDQE